MIRTSADRFIEARLRSDKNEDTPVLWIDLKYLEYCDRHNLQPLPTHHFHRAIVDHFHKPEHCVDDGELAWHGIKLISEDTL